MDPNQSKKLDQKRALARVENEFRENGSYDMLVKQCGDKLLNDVSTFPFVFPSFYSTSLINSFC